MITSIINGVEIKTGNRINEVKDVNGTVLDSVRMFDGDLDKYTTELNNKFLIWKNYSLAKRLDAILSIKENFEDPKRANILIESICSEIGKPYTEAETEISESIALFDYFLNNVNDEIFNKSVNIDPYFKTKSNYIKLSPLGIVGIIKPWNYPITNSLWSIIPALLAGNVILYKPSENCCHTAKILSDIILDSKLPEGVFNVIFGDNISGQYITECDKVSMISFTGSSETAIEIQKHSLDLGIMRKYSIESGGSDFAIIDRNIDIDFVVEGIVWGAFNNSGQVCTSIENVLVPREIFDAFIKKLVEKTTKLKAGKDYGKIQNIKLKNKIIDYLNTIKNSNTAEIILGGYINDDFLTPTLITGCDKKSINTELFSNILRIFSYSDTSDLLNWVNSSKYGLGCTIWTSCPNSEYIKLLIEEINVGMIWVNDVNVAYPEMPWTGIKHSGVGFNLSLDSIKEFSSIKSVSIDSNTNQKKEWWYPYENRY